MSNTLKLGNGKWATGKDTLLSFSDTNNNYKPLPFSFSRASSGTVINKDGLIETVGSGEPRIDFKDNTKGALLLEPTRSNIVTDSATGIFKLPTPSLINTLAPDNSNLAVIPIVYSVANRYEYIISGGTYSTNTKLTYSWYRKRISTPMVNTYLGDLRPSGVNLSYVGDTKQIESNINGYDRFEAVLNITDGSATTTVRMYFGDVIGVGNSSIAYWGHQLEQGSYATSYIPTSGQANGVTRVREEVNNENYLMSGLTDMAMFVDYELPNGNSSGFRNQLGFRDNHNANFYMIQFPSSNTYEFRYTGVANVNVDMTPSMSEQDFGLRRKLLYTKTGTTLKVFCNGVQVSTVTSASATTFSTTSEILNAGANYDIEMKIKDWKLYNNGFTDAEAIALTTI